MKNIVLIKELFKYRIENDEVPIFNVDIIFFMFLTTKFRVTHNNSEILLLKIDFILFEYFFILKNNSEFKIETKFGKLIVEGFNFRKKWKKFINYNIVLKGKIKAEVKILDFTSKIDYLTYKIDIIENDISPTVILLFICLYENDIKLQ